MKIQRANCFLPADSGGEENRGVIVMLKSRRSARNEMCNANHLHFSSAILFMTELAISHEIRLLLSEEARECRWVDLTRVFLSGAVSQR